MERGLIALDLDDSLLAEDLAIAEEDRLACAEALRAGFRIVLASGRNVTSMRAYARQLGIEREGEYLVCSNGAEITELPSGKAIVERRLPKALVRELEAFARELSLPIQAYERGAILVTEANPWTDEDTRLTGQPNEEVGTLEGVVPAAGALKLVIPGEPERLREALAAARERFAGKVRAFVSKPIFLELLPRDADKGIALAELAARLEIPRARVMAMGDAANDLGMVEWAGFGCAPANAIDEVKAVARYVSPLRHGLGAARDCVSRYLRYCDPDS